ncbi:hypothetical protein FRC20_000809 [Serendipita sp. 405]|nr:hypothetical protein FRC15_009179 [Serendipita sp. 397]KAG8796657.1 hypothetical protein FRC16_009593 [Serendipita sp. 398]KAG8855222.1 hypothetical protein FRC20_000809 [Serendipita sp. 405]
MTVTISCSYSCIGNGGLPFVSSLGLFFSCSLLCWPSLSLAIFSLRIVACNICVSFEPNGRVTLSEFHWFRYNILGVRMVIDTVSVSPRVQRLMTSPLPVDQTLLNSPPASATAGAAAT